MRWRGREKSSNVDDRRGMSGKKLGLGGGCGVIIVVLLVWLLGGDPIQFLQQVQQNAPATETGTPRSEEENELADFTKVVLKDTEDVWKKVFREQLDAQYREPTLVLFTGSARSACGFAQAATGPFYCPPDQSVYMDLSFADQLARLGGQGDFALAYVIAHEVGHHVQNLLGITDQVHSQRGKISQERYNELSVRLELQADYLSGVWAHHADEMKDILDDNDIREALDAAAAVGDDYLQKRSGGKVHPESFTHGTSRQRQEWFRRGYQSGLLSGADTFDARFE